jgi:hypothetical protein
VGYFGAKKRSSSYDRSPMLQKQSWERKNRHFGPWKPETTLFSKVRVGQISAKFRRNLSAKNCGIRDFQDLASKEIIRGPCALCARENFDFLNISRRFCDLFWIFEHLFGDP